MNKSILIGNVGNAPEIRTLDSGAKVANFSIATTEKYKDKQGEEVKLIEWHRLEVWGSLVAITENYVKKGDRICIEGKIRTEKWEDKDGNPKTTVKIRVERIELLGKRREEVEEKAEQEPVGKGTKKGTAPKDQKVAKESNQVAFEASKDDKDLPF